MKIMHTLRLLMIAAFTLNGTSHLWADYQGSCACGPGCTCDPCLCGAKFPRVCGVWFAEEPPLYKPMLADPRQVNFSAGARSNDHVLHKDIADVSFGDYLALYHWYCAPWGLKGSMQVGIEGCVWAVFSPHQESAPLINADYYAGIPITYAFDNWSFRLRFYHISCHIGDEFLLMHPKFDRRNPSTEFVDFYASYYLTKEIRFYGGLVWLVRQDESFNCSRFQGALGMEVRLKNLFGIDWCNRLRGSPFYAMHFRFSKDFKHHIDATYVLGYEWMNLSGCLQRCVRAFIEYHDGYSVEGQFCRFPTNYLSFRVSYGF